MGVSVAHVEEYFDSLCDFHSIDGHSRILVACEATWGPNSGDAWYFLQRVPIYEEENDCRLVLLVDPKTKDVIKQRASLLEYDGYKFEFIEIPDDMPVPDDYPGSLRLHPSYLNNNKRLDYLSRRKSNSRFRSCTVSLHLRGSTQFWSFENFFYRTSSLDFAQRKRLPRPPRIDETYYVQEYGIVPGKTVLLAPESNTVKALGVNFWVDVIQEIQKLGLSTISNTSSQEFPGPHVLAPWRDVIGLAELCGYVVGVRSGFFDFVCDARAKIVILAPERYQDLKPSNTREVEWITIDEQGRSARDLYAKAVNHSRLLRSFAFSLSRLLKYIAYRRRSFHRIIGAFRSRSDSEEIS